MTKKKLLLEEGSDRVVGYIESCPKAVQGRLREIRAAIREAAPDANETTSYFDIPGYSYAGYDYNGMFAWFSFHRSGIGLHLRPPTIQDHAKELAAYHTTKAIVRFPLDGKIPVPLVQRLVRSSVKVMKAKTRPLRGSSPRGRRATS
jgi:uncharacterized protein YdhG (YjbR/CyaY superfamily)